MQLSALLDGTSSLLRLRQFLARGLETIVGCVLLVAGLLKAWEPLDFIRQISDYKIISAPMALKVIAWTMIAVECGLGAALIAGYRRRMVIPLACGLIVLFLGAVGWAWASGATQDCGCFGSWVKRTPAEAFFEDLCLLGAVVLAGFLKRDESSGFTRLRLATVSLAIAVGLAVAGWSSQSARQSSDPVLRLKGQMESPFASIPIAGATVDLKTGEHLVALFDTGCFHCQEAVPTFNKLLDEGHHGAPALLALCSNSETDVKEFQRKHDSQFPIGTISREDFMRLLERGGTPRTLLVKGGTVIRIWDGVPPGTGEAAKAIREAPAK